MQLIDRSLLLPNRENIQRWGLCLLEVTLGGEFAEQIHLVLQST